MSHINTSPSYQNNEYNTLISHNEGFDAKLEPSQNIVKQQGEQCNHHQPLFLSHQQKIQATYNFQHLFRKKSSLYNIHKNKKKLISKGKAKEVAVTDNCDKDSKNVKKGHWSVQQNRKYHWFLQLNNKNFIYKHLRRSDKIFKAMSSFIGTRQAQQCRSHHQKMQKKHKHFYQIILKLRLQYYGTCNTESIKSDLQQNGYIKQSKSLLVEQNIMKQMQNTKDLEQIYNQKDEYCHLKEQYNSPMEQNNSEDQDYSNQNDDFKVKREQVNMLLGQNYQEKFNFKMY